MKRTPKINAIGLRIYGYAQPLGWNCTITEVADALGVSQIVISRVVASFGWQNRFRVAARWDRQERGAGQNCVEDTRDTHRDLIQQFANMARMGADE